MAIPRCIAIDGEEPAQEVATTWVAGKAVEFRFQWVHDRLESNDGVLMRTVDLLMSPYLWDPSPPTSPCREMTYDSLPSSLRGATLAGPLRCSYLLVSSLVLVAICHGAESQSLCFDAG